MSASTVLFLVLRAAHVLLAAVWIGAVAFTTFFLMPALEEAGPAAGPVMGALLRRKLHVFMASLGGTTVLTGLYLYYRFTGGFDPALSGTRAAMVFGTGGLAGIIALIIGGAVVSRSAKKMGELGARLAAVPATERAAMVEEMSAARRRAATASRIIIALQVFAIVLMAIGHYV
jgi:uncharacterized membrane protein